MKRLFFSILFSLFFLAGFSKSIVLLKDSITGETLPFANVFTKEGKKRTLVANENGEVIIPENLRHTLLETSYTGFDNKQFTVGISDSVMIVPLSPTTYDLQEVYIKPKKEKYSKKNNPAVEFVNKLRQDSKKYNPEKEPFYSYDKYEKTLLAINNFNGQFDSGFMAKKTKFLENYVDTSSYTGTRLLDLILKEKYSVEIMSQDPKARKEITYGYKSEGIDEVFNQENIRILLEDVIREVDIYEPNLNILQNRFVSPLSPLGPDFYKYYLSDTVYIGDKKCIELSFMPRNAQSMGFNGKLYVPVGDSTMFVKKITMRTPHDINLNFLRNLYINQNFEKDSIGNRHKIYDDVVVEMQIMAGTPEFYGRKTSVYDNFSYSPREELLDYYKKVGNDFTLQDSIGNTAQFWNEKRMVPLTNAEARLGNITKEMRKVPLIYWAEKVIRLMESGYFTTGKPSKFDIGPLNTFLSYNSVEGVRIRLGGMTMAALNPHLFLKGYGAYGTRDHKWKYGATIEYSFHKKKKHGYEWPRHGFYGSYSYDLDLLGQHYLFTNQDNIFLSLKRKSSDLVTYRKLAEAGYVLELPNNFSVEAGGKFQIQESTPWIPFIYPDGRVLRSYRQSAFNISLRWAKGEKFIQGRSTRLLVNMDPWIIQLTHKFGPKGLLRADYTTNQTELSVQKRFWFSAFGYIDIIAKAGKVWSSVYFPGLMWPNANLSYTIQPESYSLMDAMEFANDEYASLDFTYFGNGILFNHIPGIKKLKIREAITFKGLVGSLSNKNNPKYNDDLLKFPDFALARKMKKTPYMEVGVGIDNIFSVLRVDYVWRLTYRDNPGVDKSGVRISLHFTL
ncbi:MAG: carboxypeptidase-like regulatory domain-containing protein [Muribaculaceae bacterium]|nr:carboxypeptidase-like regulatory domain-containing protein [Muribaculaceae bacterium]